MQALFSTLNWAWILYSIPLKIGEFLIDKSAWSKYYVTKLKLFYGWEKSAWFDSTQVFKYLFGTYYIVIIIINRNDYKILKNLQSG